jgi:hypothetical protein
VRVILPSELARNAAETLHPVREDVIVIGALAVQIALAGHEVTLTPTRDIDAGTTAESAAGIVAHLESVGFRRSNLPHEKSFTWVADDVKVQLIRPFHPFPKPPADGLPVNTLLPELERHRWLVAFEEEPEKGLFWAARPAALVALKEAAFGRTRPSGDPVDRDFSDVALLFDNKGAQIAEEVAEDAQMRKRVLRAAERLRDEPTATEGAIRELVASGQVGTPREGEATVARAVREIAGELERDTPGI